MRQAFRRRKQLIVQLCREVPGFEVSEPDGAFYVFPKVSSYYGKSAEISNTKYHIANNTDLAMYLLNQAHVATVGGQAFGDPDCIRMSYATSDANIIEAMRRIRHALAQLK